MVSEDDGNFVSESAKASLDVAPFWLYVRRRLLGLDDRIIDNDGSAAGTRVFAFLNLDIDRLAGGALGDRAVVPACAVDDAVVRARSQPRAIGKRSRNRDQLIGARALSAGVDGDRRARVDLQRTADLQHRGGRRGVRTAQGELKSERSGDAVNYSRFLEHQKRILDLDILPCSGFATREPAKDIVGLVAALGFETRLGAVPCGKSYIRLVLPFYRGMRRIMRHVPDVAHAQRCICPDIYRTNAGVHRLQRLVSRLSAVLQRPVRLRCRPVVFRKVDVEVVELRNAFPVLDNRSIADGMVHIGEIGLKPVHVYAVAAAFAYRDYLPRLVVRT